MKVVTYRKKNMIFLKENQHCPVRSLHMTHFGMFHLGSSRVAFIVAAFILDFDAQFSYPPDAHPLRVFGVTVNGEEEIGDKAGEHLHHDAIGSPRNKMIHVEVSFPPPKKISMFQRSL